MRRSRTMCCLVALASVVGCSRSDSAAKQEMPKPIVIVAPPTAQNVVRYEQFTGRAEAIEQVEVRAKVTGFLTKVHFKPGSEVEKGAPLYDIDSAGFEAEHAISQAQVSIALARVEQMTAELERLNQGGTAVTRSEKDKARANKLEAEASLQAARSKTVSTKLNLDYCKVAAPIAGVIGDNLTTVGNLITGGLGTSTLLATIVSVDPIDVAFDIDENTLQRIQAEIRERKVPSAKESNVVVEAGLAIHGTTYPLKGKITFFNNKVDPKTGTYRLKAQFPNPKIEGGRMVTPGMFARVRIPMGPAVPALLVPESALLADQADKYLYVLGADNKAVRMNAEVGTLLGDQRVILSVRAPEDSAARPLRADEQVIVSGIQRIRPGMTVDPKSATK